MESATKTQAKNKYQVSIDLLNDAVGKEIATSLQYMYFHTHFEDDRYQYLSKIMREISIAEMRHIEEFSDRILFLQGDVDMNASFRTRQVTDVKEMLRMAMQLEQSTIDSYNEASRIASENKDAVTHKMFQDIIGEEEQHLDTFRVAEPDRLRRGVPRAAIGRRQQAYVEEFQPFRRRRIAVRAAESTSDAKNGILLPGSRFFGYLCT